MGPWVIYLGGGVGCTFRGAVRALLAPFAHVCRLSATMGQRDSREIRGRTEVWKADRLHARTDCDAGYLHQLVDQLDLGFDLVPETFALVATAGVQ